MYLSTAVPLLILLSQTATAVGIFKVKLGFNGLVASISPDKTLPVPGASSKAFSDFNWAAYASKLRADAQSIQPGDDYPEYDVWPGETPETHRQAKFEINHLSPVPGPDDPGTGAKFLEAFAHVFDELAARDRKKRTQFLFDGFVFDSSTGEKRYSFRMYKVPAVCGQQKKHNIKRLDMENIYEAKKVVLIDTERENDLLLFLGNPASYIYYAMNLPSDHPLDHRHCQLVPWDVSTNNYADHLKEIQQTDFFGIWVRNQLLPMLDRSVFPYRNIVIIGYDPYNTIRNLFVSLIVAAGYAGPDHQPFWISIEGEETPWPTGIRGGALIQVFPRVPIVIKQGLDRIARGTIGYLAPPFPEEYWHISAVNIWWPALPERAATVDKIRKYCADRNEEKRLLNLPIPSPSSSPIPSAPDSLDLASTESSEDSSPTDSDPGSPSLVAVKHRVVGPRRDTLFYQY
ncbi:MAG: hypothetical protein M1825_005930 [Sarcosagium campestre]|nr:MAG: hypothetical protein M1825_005930 [Sarcosagium campestre]